MQCTTLNEVQQMPFLHKWNTIFGTHTQHQGIWPLPSKTQAIQNMHPPKMPKQVHAFLGLVGYYRKFIKNFEKIAKPLTLLTCQQVKFDWTLIDSSWCFPNTQRIHYSSTNTMIPKSQQMIHSIYWCIRWCLQCTVIPGTWWYRIPYCFSFTYVFGNTKKMEHHRTRSLWSLLCNYQIELLSPGSRYYSTKWSHTTKQIP